MSTSDSEQLLEINNSSMYHKVRDFLYREAGAIDGREFRKWVGMMTDDVEYLIPVRATHAGENHDDDFIDMYHILDDEFSLNQRIDRLETEYAWAEQPPSRTRHFITNIRIVDFEEPDEISVVSNLLLYITEGDDPNWKIISGKREDVLKDTDEGLRLDHRTVKLDNTTLPIDRISIFI